MTCTMAVVKRLRLLRWRVVTSGFALSLVLQTLSYSVGAQVPFAITFPPAGAVVIPGQPVTIQWTGGNPGWLVEIQLIDLSLNQVVAGVAANVPNAGSFTWTLPVTLPFGLQACGRTLQFFVRNVQQTSWIHGPLFTTAACVPPNAPPIANAGGSVSIRVGATVTLHGNAYDDNTPTEALSFSWTFVLRPTGSAATLVNNGTATPSFVADQAGTYVVQLTVRDAAGLDSVPSHVMISSLNQAPTANAGPDQLVVVFQTVQLDGSGTTDPENDHLSFHWGIASAPAGSSAVLNGVGARQPNFQPDQPGSYTMFLIVADFLGAGIADTVEIIAITAAAFAEKNTLDANQLVLGLGPAQVTTAGNQNAFSNHLNNAVKEIQKGDTTKAIDRLNDAIVRADGCERNGVPDGSGPGRDWVTDCSAQAQLLVKLRAAVRAVTP